jgi:uncharacterized membrane protein YeaQ/YmgE (transglycosylase-associated protein family)
MTGSIIWWVIIGAVAGALAKFIMPGREGGGIITTILLGIVGGLVGGFLAEDVLHIGIGGAVIGPIIVATIGAIVVLFVYNLATGRQRV